MKKYSVLVLDDNDNKFEVFNSNSLEQAVSVAITLYSNSKNEYYIYSDNDSAVVKFFKLS